MHLLPGMSKTTGSELRGQEEAACTHISGLRDHYKVIYMDGRSKFLKCCSSATITAIT